MTDNEIKILTKDLIIFYLQTGISKFQREYKDFNVYVEVSYSSDFSEVKKKTKVADDG